MNELTQYIITWLCYGNKKAAARVELSSPVDWTLRYPELDKSLPAPLVVKKDETDENFHIVISPDYIYNTFFFISRAEELLNSKRDEHGRFLAKYSLLGKNNRLQIPLLDEYARILMKELELPLPTPHFNSICLTHDIDTTDYYHHLRGALGGIRRGRFKAVWTSLKDIQNDPAYTFDWLNETDNLCQKQKTPFESIYFVKATNGHGYDYPQYSERTILSVRSRYPLTKWGVHSSYYGNLSKVNRQSKIYDYQLHRSHYLKCSIEQMQNLADFGVTDDYTMGFADMAGFRLQTTRPVRWINPKTLELTHLTLHPLTIMDCTLSNSNYMNLTEDEAYFYCQELISRVKEHHGELVLLWHNTSINDKDYHRSLYSKLLQSL